MCSKWGELQCTKEITGVATCTPAKRACLRSSFKGGKAVDTTSKYVPLSIYISSSVVTLYVRFWWRILRCSLWIWSTFEVKKPLSGCCVISKSARSPKQNKKNSEWLAEGFGYPEPMMAKCMEASWKRFQTHSSGSLFLVPLESVWYFSQKARATACGCVGEIRMPSNVQSPEIHTPHNVKAFLFTIYNARTRWFTEAQGDYLHRGLVSAISGYPEGASRCRPTKWFLSVKPRLPSPTSVNCKHGLFGLQISNTDCPDSTSRKERLAAVWKQNKLRGHVRFLPKNVIPWLVFMNDTGLLMWFDMDITQTLTSVCLRPDLGSGSRHLHSTWTYCQQLWNTGENAPISHCSKAVTNLSKAASPQRGPTDVSWKTVTPQFAFDTVSFKQRREQASYWENCKRERQDELLGPQKSCQKPFLSTPCPTDIHLASWKVRDGENLGLEKFFSTSKRHLATGLSFWKNEKVRKKKGRKGRNGEDFQTLKNRKNGAKTNVALCCVERRNQTHTEGVDSGSLCVPVPKNQFNLSFLCVPRLHERAQKDTDRANRKR